MKNIINEELGRMKNLFGYERGRVISEQATTPPAAQTKPVSIPGGISQQALNKIIAISNANKKGLRGSYLFPPQQQEIDSEFGAGTYSNFFRNGGEEMLKNKTTEPQQIKNVPQIPLPTGVSQQAVDKIMAISAENKKGLRGSYLFPPQQQEIDSEFGTGTYSNFFKNGGEDVLKGEKTFTKQTQTNTTVDWSKYPCVLKHPNAKKGKTAKGSEYYLINNYAYYNNGRKYDMSTKKLSNYTCNDVEFKTAQNKKTTVKTPFELKNADGIKKFQDWLDVNVPGWATGYQGGILNKGQNGSGYGRFGPRTQKAWKLYSSFYIKSLAAPVAPAPVAPAPVAPAPVAPAPVAPAPASPNAGGTPGIETPEEQLPQLMQNDGRRRR